MFLYCSVYVLGGPADECLKIGVLAFVGFDGSTSANLLATSTGAWIPMKLKKH